MDPADDQRSRWDALAVECLAALRAGAEWRGAAERLTRASLDAESAEAASRALFGGVVEPLADSFDAADAERYRTFFQHVLRVGGIEPARGDHRRKVELERFRRVVVLSRVTLGADIAVSSVFLRASLELGARPEVFFAAGPKSLELFAGEPRIRALPLAYPRAGELRQRLEVWREAQRALAELAEDLEAGELLVLDPDSRITQLGLLPAAPPDQPYLFFDSRSCRQGEPGPLGAIAAEWLEERFGASETPPLPWIAPSPQNAARAEQVRRGGDGPLAAVNFGIGGNASKRVPDPFEAEAAGLLRERGYRVVVDAGSGEEERGRAERLAAADGVALHQGSFASFAAVIGVSDLFVGYDSGAAHAAAALGVPAIDVFAGASGETMRSRWAPWGERPALVLPVEAGEAPDSVLWRLRELLP